MRALMRELRGPLWSASRPLRSASDARHYNKASRLHHRRSRRVQVGTVDEATLQVFAGLVQEVLEPRLEKLQTELQGQFKELKVELQGQFKELQGQLEELQGQQKETQGHTKELRSQLKKLQGQLGELANALGRTTEASRRPQISHVDGYAQSLSLLLDSLAALSSWLAGCLLLEERDEDLKICDQLCRRLLNEDVATKMLRRIDRDLYSVRMDPARAAAAASAETEDSGQALDVDERGDSDGGETEDTGLSELYHALLETRPFFPSPAGSLDREALGRFISMLQQDKHKHLLRTLNGLKDVLNPNSTEEDKIKKLRSPQGMGICLALFAAEEQKQEQAKLHSPAAVSAVEAEGEGVERKEDKKEEGAHEGAAVPHIKLYRDIKFGQHEVELDVRGIVSVINGTANIWVGEFKSSSGAYGVAKAQLELRLALLEWAVLTIREDTTQISLTGKVYMPEQEVRKLPKKSERAGNSLIMVVGLEGCSNTAYAGSCVGV